MSDLVTISREGLKSELSQMIRDELSLINIAPSRINDSLMSVENLDHHMKIAEMFSKSQMVPKNYIGKPYDILIAMEMGHQLGLPYMQALQDIAVINGKPCLYGDGFVAVIKAHKDYEWMTEGLLVNNNGDVYGYEVTIKRRNHEPHSQQFTYDMAKKAKLLGKPGPWTDYPERMLKWRATSWCGRNVFADALRGVQLAEEVQDYIETDYEVVHTKNSKVEELKAIVQGKMNGEHKTSAHTAPHSDNQAEDNNIESQNTSVPAKSSLSENKLSMDNLGESTIDAYAKKEAFVGITEGQLADIHMLINDKKIKEERIQGILKKLGASCFEELSHSDANRVLTFLEKA